MSSARQAPRPSFASRYSQRVPASWYGRSVACSASPGSTRASPSGCRSDCSVSASHGPATTRDHVRVGLRRRRVAGHVRARDEAHGLGEAQPVLVRRAARRLEPFESVAQPRRVDRHPAAADQGEALRPAQQSRDLLGRQRLAVERHRGAEVEQRLGADAARRLGADGRRDLRPRRPRLLPAPRHAHHDTRGLEPGHVLQQRVRLLHREAQRVEDLARVDERAQPRALRGGALHRQQQRQQRLAPRGAGVLAQRLAERQVLRLAVRGEPRRVGREERERRLLVEPVLREVAVHAPDEVPGGAPALQLLLDREPRPAELLPQRRAHLLPERLEHLRGQVLGARHRRRGGGERDQLRPRRLGQRHPRAPLGDAGHRAQGRDERAAQLAPVGEHGRQRGRYLGRAEVKQAEAVAALERNRQPLRHIVGHARRVRRGFKTQPPVRRQRGCEAHWRRRHGSRGHDPAIIRAWRLAVKQQRAEISGRRTRTRAARRGRSARLWSRGPRRTRTRAMPGAVVRNEMVPSGFLREATSLFHSPKSKTVVAPARRSRRSRRARRSRSAAPAWRPRRHRRARSAASARRRAGRRSSSPAPRRPRRPPDAPSKSTSSSLRRNTVAQDPARIAVREDHRADLLLGQPHHVAVVADHVAAVVDDRDAVLRVDHQAHAVRDVLADRDLRLAPLEQRPPSRRSACRPAALPRRAPSARTSARRARCSRRRRPGEPG